MATTNTKYTLEDIQRLKRMVALKMEAEKIGIQHNVRQMFTPRYPKLWNLLSLGSVMTVCKGATKAVYIYKTASSVLKLFRRK